MKKLLGIVFIGLLFSSSLSAKDILIKCVGKHTDNFVINLKSKTWNNAASKKSLARKVYIDDQVIVETHYMDDKWPCNTKGKCTVGISIINRLTGKYSSVFLKVPKNELHKEWFEKKPMFESDEKFIERARDFIAQRRLNSAYLSSSYSSQCALDDKKF